MWPALCLVTFINSVDRLEIPFLEGKSLSDSKNTTQEEAFFDAIKMGDLAAVRRTVEEDLRLLDAFDYRSFGATPLTLATFCGSKNMIEELLNLGADPNRKSDWWAGPWSPLHSVIQAGNYELAEYLLERGASLDVHTAAALGRTDELAKILDREPDLIRQPGGDGCQPLHFAGTIAAVDVLLDRGADIHARCVDHYSTPIQYHCHPRPKIAQYLVSKGAEPDIFSATMAGDTATIKRLIETDPNVINERINQERFPPGPEHDVHNIMTFTAGNEATPMHAAAKSNQWECVKILAAAGCDTNARGGYDDAAPLHIAAWENHGDVARQLIACGADMNQRSGEIHNNTPAGWAIVAGSADVFDVLLESGAEVLDYFLPDAKAAVAGEFRKYKNVPQENYDRILLRLSS